MKGARPDGLMSGVHDDFASAEADAGGCSDLQHQRSPYAAVELLRYARLLRSHWKLLCGVPVALTLVVALYTKFVATRYYRAEAVITPVSQSESAAYQTGGMVVGGLGVGGGGLGELLGLGGAADNELEAARDTTMMNSYSFTVDLARHYNLIPVLVKESGLNPGDLTMWQVYKALTGNFNTSYDYKTGELSVYYLDPDAAVAKRILSDYIESLREKLSSQVIQSSAAAAQALRQSVDKTSDTLLQSQLYELMARQIERGKLAQLDADFSFKTPQPPFVPNFYYTPTVLFRSLMTMLLSFFLLCSWVLVRDWMARAGSHLDAREGPIQVLKVADEVPDDHTSRPSNAA